MKITIEIDEKTAENVLEIASERAEGLNAVIGAIFAAGIAQIQDRPAKKARKPRAKRVKPENGTEATKSASQTAPGDMPPTSPNLNPNPALRADSANLGRSQAETP